MRTVCTLEEDSGVKIDVLLDLAVILSTATGWTYFKSTFCQILFDYSIYKIV